ncbi:MAG: putative DNA-binding domain-containing protein [Burkholderiaceae bacterium]
MSARADAEAGRQQGLLQALRASTLGGLPAGAQPLPGRRGDADAQAGLRAYRANAQAMAERALAAAYPVLARWLGGEAVAALARDLWRAHPPARGDLAWFGAELAAWLPRVPEWADMPYLADLARLEWALHRAHAAADPADEPPALQALATDGAEALQVRFVAGSALVGSAWPVLTLWRAHQVPAGTEPALGPVREALAQGRGEAAWVWRRGHRVEAAPWPPASPPFTNTCWPARRSAPPWRPPWAATPRSASSPGSCARCARAGWPG